MSFKITRYKQKDGTVIARIIDRGWGFSFVFPEWWWVQIRDDLTMESEIIPEDSSEVNQAIHI